MTAICKKFYSSPPRFFFLDFDIFPMPKGQANRICLKSRSVYHIEDFHFFDFEIRRTRQSNIPVQSNVVGASPSQAEHSCWWLRCSCPKQQMSSPPKHGPNPESQPIAKFFSLRFNANLICDVLCGFFSVKRKLFRLPSALQCCFSESHFTRSESRRRYSPFVSKITVRVFG
jgi:hypothetical protein